MRLSVGSWFSTIPIGYFAKKMNSHLWCMLVEVLYEFEYRAPSVGTLRTKFILAPLGTLNELI